MRQVRRSPGAVVWAGQALSGQTAPYSALRHRSWSEPAAKKTDVEARLTDCEAFAIIDVRARAVLAPL